MFLTWDGGNIEAKKILNPRNVNATQQKRQATRLQKNI